MLRLAFCSLGYLLAGFAVLILLLAGRRRPLPSALSGLAVIFLWPFALPYALIVFMASCLRARPRMRNACPPVPR
jgi:hypothetical protein